MNSDISTRIMAPSLSNKNSANDLQSSVFPTPVGPRKRNEPLGRLGSANPARERRTALETALTASDWPITRWCNASSMRISLSRSPSSILFTGIPVHLATTSAISSSVTLLRNSFFSTSSWETALASCFSNWGMTLYWISAIFSRLPERWATSRSTLACSSSLLIWVAPCIEAFSAVQICSRSA